MQKKHLPLYIPCEAVTNDEGDLSDENFESDCDDSTSEIEPDLNDLASELTYLTSFRTMLPSQQYQAESYVSNPKIGILVKNGALRTQ
uniref:Uncharacterized protein n=1 Tax=Romanomermis culicivorax TaxID=13658 RepID=A0A915HTK1_ROMCU